MGKTAIGLIISALQLFLCATSPTSARAMTRIDLTSGLRLRVQPFGTYGESRSRVVVQPVPSIFRHKLTLPAEALLRTAIAVPLRIWTADLSKKVRPAIFTIRWSSGSGSSVVFEKRLDARQKGDQKWLEVVVDLSKHKGETGVITFSVEASGGSSGFTALWDNPVILSLAPPVPPSVVLIVIDALRASHLGSYGYHRPTSPYLDRLAAESLLFLNAFSSAPKTIPSVPQLLTGSYFPDQVRTASLMELLDRAGFSSTRAIVNNPYVAAWLQQRGQALRTVVASELNAREIGRLALDWLARRRGEPFFLFLHYLDTHTPYQVPGAFAKRFIDNSYQGPVGLTFNDITGTWQGRYKQPDRQRIIDLYDGTIRYTDRQIGMLIEKLKELGLYDRSLIIVTADHGEELWDHGRFFHGQSLFDELLRVPLIVKLPHQERGGTRISSLARLVDVTPSIGALMEHAAGLQHGALADSGWNGRPLPAMINSKEKEDRTLFATVSRAEPNAPPRHAVRTGRYKYILTMSTGQEQLFDLATDPGEKHNIAEQSPEVAAKLRSTLAEITAPLETAGYQIQISNRSARTVSYNIGLSVSPAAPFVELSRVNLETGDTIAVARHSSGFTLRGKLPAGDRDAVRFDILAAGGQCKLVAWAAGAPLPPAAVRVGHQGRQPQSMPALIPIAAPYLEGPIYSSGLGQGSEIELVFWRKPKTAGKAPALTRKMRERLKSLGYTE